MESVKLWMIGGPIAFQIICQFATESVATIFVGHFGDVELSAFAIATSVVGNFALGVMLGMVSALETLCGQAFGAGQVHMLGIYMQRSILILFGACIVLSPIYIFATPIFKLTGQPDEIANLAGYYALLIIPQMFSLSLSFPTQKFLQAQSKVAVLAWIAGFALVAQTFWCWLFVNIFQWGPTGAALAFDLTGWGSALLQFIYVVGWCKEGWQGFSWAAFRDIWAFVRLSLESAVMLCLEIWHISSIIILAGKLENAVTAVGALSICMNVDGWEAMLFVGVNAAIRNYVAVIFTKSEEMKRVVAHLSGLLGITMLLNSVQTVISGVAIGGGWQALVAYINLACYYVFGLPLGYILGYVFDFGVVGIWGGMIAGVALQTLLLVLVLYRINWNKEAEPRRRRQSACRNTEVRCQYVESEKSTDDQLPISNGRH